MKTHLQVLSKEECDKIHERTLYVLSHVGVKVDTAKGRAFLKKAGADVDENTHIVKISPDLVESSLKQVPRDLTLGARRSGADLKMNNGNCVLCMDGEASVIIDRKTGERRPSTFNDWLEGTRIGDAIDDFGMYWGLCEATDKEDTVGNYVNHLRYLFGNFSKHVQDPFDTADKALWLLEVLQVIFGDKEAIKKHHPFSFLLCPQSPLMIDEQYTDAYLELLGWDIPVAIMPMMLMGATSPGSMVSTIVQGNSEVMAMICLLQAASPGLPVLYAPILSIMDPRTGRLYAGAIENSIMSSAQVEMGRYYGLPVEGTAYNTDQYEPSIQAGYERALNGILPTLSWPDIMIAPGLLGGSMVMSLEQMIIDIEIFRLSKHARRGVVTDDDNWLEDVIAKTGPGGNYLMEMSTAKAIRSGEWYVSDFGMHDSYENWIAAGKKPLMEEAAEKVADLLNNYEPMPFTDDQNGELDKIQKRAEQNS
ncbi:MAG: trimethylamine methyltransferase family protein [Desulfobacterales bacterium]|nr:trimethylamine methyltransferase family protein [Desulfobacterales bacterium]